MKRWRGGAVGALASMVACASHPPGQGHAASSQSPASRASDSSGSQASARAQSESDADHYGRELIEGAWCTGVVMAIVEGATPTVRAYGRNREGAPVDQDTVFEIGSVSKVFTSLLLADGVARGTTTLDAPVQSLLGADYPVPLSSTGRAITLADLATHSSGLPALPPEGMQGPTDPYVGFDRATLVQALAHTTLNHEPGSQYAYSNYGAGLLGTALAEHAHTTYDALIQQRIVVPLEMHATGVAWTEAQRAHAVDGHDADGAVVPPWHLAFLAGAGGIHSSARDLIAFVRAQIDPPHDLASAMRLSQTSRVPMADHAGSVALGWHVSRDGHVRWHNGETGGFHTFVAFDPETRTGVVVLANGAVHVIDEVGAALLARLRGDTVHPPSLRPVVPMEPVVLERFVGTYLLGGAMSFQITREGTLLRARLGAQPAFRIYPLGPTEFAYRAVEATLTFTLDANAHATQVTLHQNGHDTAMPRVP